ncbi:MAG TPA: DNA gyrase inhibitor YacG [Acetobacteraceae bacterium]|nr:DNA gyrase inhibitor YacG [Acetobacteraceae bacterium]
MSKAHGCPVCGKPSDATLRPFCSRRCADIDLGRWISGQYRLPGGPESDMEEQDTTPDRSEP